MPGRTITTSITTAGLATLLAAPFAGAQTFTAEPAPEWTALFDRTSGWTGADGIYSIPLSGNDAHGAASRTPTLFLFSDTAIGEVAPDGSRRPGATLVNNTLAIMRGDEPDPDRIRFITAENLSGSPKAIFVPDTPNAQPDDWYWLGDGAVVDGATRLVAYRMRSNGQGGVFGFETAGVSIITLPLDSRPPFDDHTQVEAPLFVPSDGEHGDTTYGAGIFVNTEAAGAPDPDGFVYIYGVRNDLSKKLLVARVTPEAFMTFDAWRFYDGAEWVDDLHAAAPLTNRVSNELSVSPLPNGQYILVFQTDALGHDVGVRVGETPVGPFGPVRRVYTAPEPSRDPEIFVYNAKAHPHLSAPDELLISYNVNTLDFWGDFFRYADIYRPRFIRLKFNP
ncbi:MAG: DUF4185 domain-containing protein [Phycisphaerales bacterium]